MSKILSNMYTLRAFILHLRPLPAKEIVHTISELIFSANASLCLVQFPEDAMTEWPMAHSFSRRIGADGNGAYDGWIQIDRKAWAKRCSNWQ